MTTAITTEQATFITRTINGYIECLLWSESCRGTAPSDVCDHMGLSDPSDCDKSLSHALNYDASDLAAEAEQSVSADVSAFVLSNWADVADLDPSQVGHDFMLTRCGHGTGFWDRGLGARGLRLSEASRPYGETGAYVGDDGKVYVG